jgi:hypothetical protein
MKTILKKEIIKLKKNNKINYKKENTKNNKEIIKK